MVKHNYNPTTRLVALATWLTAALVLCGCEAMTGERIAEMEADRTLRSLTQIKPVEDPNVRLSSEYTAPPKIIKQNIGGAPEWKLLYFARYHSPGSLKQMLDQQFAQRSYDKKGRVSRSTTYVASVNPACNQLIVRCPNEPDVTAALEVLESVDVPPIQVRIDCLIYKRYADVTVDRETTILIENVLGEGITLGGKQTNGDLLPAFPGAALREVARSTFGLKIGYVSGKEGHWFKSLVDILESKGYLKIMMNPSLEVVNGQPARIMSKEYVPWQTIRTETRDLGQRTYDRYVWIVDELIVTPHVFADGSIALETSARISSKSTPEGVKQIPILTERHIQNKENRIRRGESLIIGGIRKPERRAIVRGVPGLKDIPLIGMFFSSKDFEERAQETVFVLTPTISKGGVPNKQMVDSLKAVHKPPLSGDTLHDAVADPFGFQAGQRQPQQELLESERAVLDAEKRQAASYDSVSTAGNEAGTAQTEATEAISQLETARITAQQMQEEAKRATAEAEALLRAAQAAEAEAAKGTGDTSKLRAEALRLARQAEAASKKAQEKWEAAEAILTEQQKNGDENSRK